MKHNRRCRKLIAILLCICLMAPMISGCGEKKGRRNTADKQWNTGVSVWK